MLEVTLDKLPSLSRSQLPHLENGNVNLYALINIH